MAMSFTREYTRGTLMAEPQEYLALKRLTDALDALKISYAIGGSIASSVYGKVRFTQDADINVESFEDKAEQFYAALKDDFYISRDAMHQAISSRGSFNLIHPASAFKIDLFVRGDDDFDRLLFLRRTKVQLDESLDQLFDIVSAEDIVILKLQWHRASDCISERQWSDVLEVLAVQAESLDMKYLRDSANRLDLKETLQKAIQESRM